LNVKAELDPNEVTLRPVVDPPELTLRAVVDPQELTVKAQLQAPESPIKAQLEAPDLTVKAQLEVPELPIKAQLEGPDEPIKAQLEVPDEPIKAQLEAEDLTVKVELPAGTIPPHSHGPGRPFIILPDGARATPVYVVPSHPLSPLTSDAQGIYIPPLTYDWLGEFYATLGACEDVRVTVTGYASRRGFGDPRHQSLWEDVAGEEEQAIMNCGLANLRARTVVSALLGSPGWEPDRLAAADRALKEECTVQQDCGPEEDCGLLQQECLRAKAETVLNELRALCTPTRQWLHAGGKDRPPVHVRSWGQGDTVDNWSWVGDDDTRLLSRSVHITLGAVSGELACPKASGVGESPSDQSGT